MHESRETLACNGQTSPRRGGTPALSVAPGRIWDMNDVGWLIAGLILGTLLGWALARAGQSRLLAAKATAIAEREAATQQLRQIREDREQLLTQFKVLSAEAAERQGRAIDASADRRLAQTEALLAPMRESLARYDERLNEADRRTAVLTGQLREQVAQVQSTGTELRRETNALVTALRKPQVRGAWGELQLQRVVELAGMVEHCDFVLQETTQTTTGSRIRPDLKVLLSRDRFIYVDSKVPLESFLAAHESSDAQEQAQHLAQFGRNVQAHVDQLSSKEYHKAENGTTPEFVVMFLASEALAAEALNQQPGLLEYASQRSVVLATPSSLIAMLKAVAFSWRQEGLADSAREVFNLARELYDRLSTLGKHFDKVGRSLGAAVKSYNETVGSIEGRVFPTARRLHDLQVTDKELDAVEGITAGVRTLTAPELVADASEVASLIGRGTATESTQGGSERDGATMSG